LGVLTTYPMESTIETLASVTATAAPPRQTAKSVLETLAMRFTVFRDCRPLAIGIHKAIRARIPDIDQGQLRAAMKFHTASTKYLKAISQAETRFDLDGNPSGEVTAEQRKQASDSLRERFKKGAERKKAEQLEKERQDNLLKLAEKFNQR